MKLLVGTRSPGKTREIRELFAGLPFDLAFPADRLEPGHYSIKIRALGYVLDGPRAVDIMASGATADVKLKEALNLAPQLV